MPDINRATVGGEDAIGLRWHTERRVRANHTPGKALMVSVKRWIFQVVTIHLTMACFRQSGTCARLYNRALGSEGQRRDLFPDYPSEEA
jgi:hypothetical protein